MLEFNLGDYIEIGIGKSIYDANKIIKYFRMDKEGYSRLSVKEAFKRKWNIIYVKKVYDESTIPCEVDSKFSDFL